MECDGDRRRVTVIPELRTDRLLLRAFHPTDFEAYAEMCADPEVMRYLSGEPLGREEAWRQLAFLAGHWSLRGFGMWAVEEADSGAFVGRLGLHYPDGWPDREVGWTLARRFWGRGLAFEGAQAALRYAFETLGWKRAISLIHPRNRRSARLATRLGGRLEGTEVLRGHRVELYSYSEAPPARPSP